MQPNVNCKRPKLETDWSPSSWKKFPIKQQPDYHDQETLTAVLEQLKEMPPIVHAEEIESLKDQLAEVCHGKRFILHGGDCAERFRDCTPSRIDSKLKIILQMSLVLVWGSRVPLVRIGRIAGQYMKPRSKSTEVVEGREVCSYKGDSINSFSNLDQRTPDPKRLRDAYFYSSTTMNYVRGLLVSGFADLNQPSNWDISSFKQSAKRETYELMIQDLFASMRFMQACGAKNHQSMRAVELFNSHEGLVLDYEQAMTRKVGDKYYNAGAHFLWIGDRTRQLDGAHVEYFRGIENPIGIKVGPTTDPKELVELVRKINPKNQAGRITLITRFGAGRADKLLPPVIEAVREAGLAVVYECDPMHGNTRTSSVGVKTRSFDDILQELHETFDVHERLKSWLGGVHFEMTGDNVTECTGGATDLTDVDLSANYESFCDPRLNYNQSLEMAFLMAKRLAARFQALEAAKKTK